MLTLPTQPQRQSDSNTPADHRSVQIPLESDLKQLCGCLELNSPVPHLLLTCSSAPAPGNRLCLSTARALRRSSASQNKIHHENSVSQRSATIPVYFIQTALSLQIHIQPSYLTVFDIPVWNAQCTREQIKRCARALDKQVCCASERRTSSITV